MDQKLPGQFLKFVVIVDSHTSFSMMAMSLKLVNMFKQLLSIILPIYFSNQNVSTISFRSCA